ncbi:F-box protein SKIP19-like [Salvia miltiorrhiza]|uniref:F-box protein SKIP19-like n=1 Tax=Salvia miltiorrhiza TaxID=226208 RepID=UPI0025ABA214|nr:F-box protein SKIP19-like [Salvia miltiorrhiza]
MSSSSSPKEAAPPWLELPREITSAILHKLGAIEILTTAQSVCTAWQSVCRDPSMWRCIDMRNTGDLWDMPYNLEKMCRHAVDRSQGQLIDINIEYFGTDELLHYISQRSSQLRRLQLVFSYGITGDGLIEAVKKFPLLEELHLYYTSIDAQAIEAIGRLCPHLKSFTSNNRWYKQEYLVCDMDARAIAENMPQLRHLQLFGNKMTNEGLQAILDGCPHLELLDLRQCFNIHFGGNIGRLCTQRIRDLRRPHDSTDDYPFDADIYDYETSDDDYITGFSDMDLVSDYDDYLEFSGASDCSGEYFDYHDAW